MENFNAIKKQLIIIEFVINNAKNFLCSNSFLNDVKKDDEFKYNKNLFVYIEVYIQ